MSHNLEIIKITFTKKKKKNTIILKLKGLSKIS